MPSLLDSYQTLIADKYLAADPAQERGVTALDALYHRIVNVPSQLQGHLWGRLWDMVTGQGGPMARSGVYLYGPVGRGKTRLMDLFFKALPDDILKRRVHFHAFMMGVHDFLHQQRKNGGVEGVDGVLPRYAANLAATTQVLCFDEFHVLDVADAMILSRLFTALFNAGIRVVMTSNVAPVDLYKGGLQRELFLPFIDLIKTKMDVVHINGGRDYRLDRLKGRPVYFMPIGTGADKALNDMFDDLTDGADPEPVVLHVKGRAILIPRTGHGVARLTFSELCEKPLGAADYLALAAMFHTILIDHVPKLSYDRRNEAKRFVTLIDVLYEHRRRVVISADAAPDALYVAGDTAFEFARTVSRLREMQSATYLQACLSDTAPAL